MTRNKITIETNEDYFFEYMKFKEAVNKAAVIIKTKSPYSGDRHTDWEELRIISKPEAFQEINKVIGNLEIKVLALSTEKEELRMKCQYLESAI